MRLLSDYTVRWDCFRTFCFPSTAFYWFSWNEFGSMYLVIFEPVICTGTPLDAVPNDVQLKMEYFFIAYQFVEKMHRFFSNSFKCERWHSTIERFISISQRCVCFFQMRMAIDVQSQCHSSPVAYRCSGGICWSHVLNALKRVWPLCRCANIFIYKLIPILSRSY